MHLTQANIKKTAEVGRIASEEKERIASEEKERIASEEKERIASDFHEAWEEGKKQDQEGSSLVGQQHLANQTHDGVDRTPPFDAGETPDLLMPVLVLGECTIL